MNKLEMVKYLIQEIEEEKTLFKTYEEDIKQAKLQAEKTNSDWYWPYKKYQGRNPSKARIKENCKKIRQLMLDISKEEI